LTESIDNIELDNKNKEILSSNFDRTNNKKEVIKLRKIIILVLIIMYSIISIRAAEIEVWCGWEGDEIEGLLGAVSKYERLTGEKVNLKKIPFAALNSRFKGYVPRGKGPDIIIGPSDWIGQFVTEDLIEPLDKYISESEKKQFIVSVINGCYYNGKLYGIPESYKVLALIYNKDIIKIPPKNTKELLEIGRKYTDIDENRYGLAYKTGYYENYAWIGGFGGKALDSKNNPTYTSKESKRGFKFIKDLNTGKNRIMPGDMDTGTTMTLFEDGLTPMIFGGSWITAELMKKNINFGVARIPLVSETGKWPTPFVGAEIVMISSKSKLKEKAYSFLKYFTSEENQIENIKIGHLPSRISIYENEIVKRSKMYEYIIGFKNQAEVGEPFPTAPEIAIAIWPFASMTVRRIINEEMSIDEALKDAQKKSEIDIKKYRDSLKK
jgi:maltose-binding protein MalE